MIIKCLCQNVRKLLLAKNVTSIKELVESFPGAKYIDKEKCCHITKIFVEGKLDAIDEFTIAIEGEKMLVKGVINV